MGSLREEHGMTGFHYFFEKIVPEEGFDWNLIPKDMRLVAVITNCRTGRAEYPEYGKSDFEKAVAASATVPYVSRPVIIDGTPYLDGGCADRIPYQWALNEGYEKIVIVRTRDLQYRKKEKSGQAINALMYRKSRISWVICNFTKTSSKRNISKRIKKFSMKMK